ncbi:unnamed protein product [Somion occarium]|uniref:C2H2-type domain-containing protein n=1 Tax=Somion occarium TaxID=3059160 RepID=A0ABP1CIV4_9APHY
MSNPPFRHLSDEQIAEITPGPGACPCCNKNYTTLRPHYKNLHNLQTTIVFHGDVSERTIYRDAFTGKFHCPRCGSTRRSTSTIRSHTLTCTMARPMTIYVPSNQPYAPIAAGSPRPAPRSVVQHDQVYQPLQQLPETDLSRFVPLPVIQSYIPPPPTSKVDPFTHREVIDLTGEDDDEGNAGIPPKPISSSSAPVLIPARDGRPSYELESLDGLELVYPDSDELDEDDSRHAHPSSATMASGLTRDSPSSAKPPIPLQKPPRMSPFVSRDSVYATSEHSSISSNDPPHMAHLGPPTAESSLPKSTLAPISITSKFRFSWAQRLCLDNALSLFGLYDTNDMDILCSLDPSDEWISLRNFLLKNGQLQVPTVLWMTLRKAMLARRMGVLSRSLASVDPPLTSWQQSHNSDGSRPSALETFSQTLRNPLGKYSEVLVKCGIESAEALDMISTSCDDWDILRQELIGHGMSEFGWLLVKDGLKRWSNRTSKTTTKHT